MAGSAIPEIVKKNVRAVLLSKIGGVLATQFLKDYRILVQEKLLYVDYGFRDIEGFIKAIPEYARFEYSQKEMAFKIFGVGDPKTYMSMAAKKAQGMSMQETDDAKKMYPNERGYYTICFRSELIDSTSRGYLMSKFSEVAEVAEVNVTQKWVFIRYTTKNGALAALQKYSDDYDMRIADEKQNKGVYKSRPSPQITSMNKERSRQNGNGENGKKSKKTMGCFNCMQPGHKAYQCKHKNPGRKRQHKRSDADHASGAYGYREIQVYFGNIAASKSDEDFQALIQVYDCRDIRVIRKDEKIFAFVTVNSMQDAQAIIDGLNLVNFGGRCLQVRLSDSTRLIDHSQNQESSFSNQCSSELSSDSDTIYFLNDSSLQYSSESDLSFSNLNIQVSADGDKVVSSSAVCSETSLQSVLDEMPELEDIEDEDDDSACNPFSIFVGNFPAGITERELRSLFWVYGVLDVNVINNGFYGKACTKAYVSLSNAKSARAAISHLNQLNYYGSVLLVAVPHMDQALLNKTSTISKEPEINSISASSSLSALDYDEVENITFDRKIQSFSHLIDKLRGWRNTIEPHMIIKVYVTNVERVDIFWGQVLNEKQEMVRLKQLMQEIQNPAVHLCNKKGLGRCAVKFENDWYRAWVIKVLPDQNKILVFFIDYGNVCVVENDNAQILPPQFWCLAPRCRPFMLIDMAKSAKDLDSTIVYCKVITSAPSSHGFITEVILVEKSVAHKKKYKT